MSIFTFLADVGRNLVGAGGSAAPSAADIQGELSRLNLGASGVTAAVDGGTVTLTGAAPDAATREKIVLAVGNLQGVSKVDDQLGDESRASDGTVTGAIGSALSGAAAAVSSAVGSATAAVTGSPDAGTGGATGPGGSTFYTVKKGDTLSAIAKSHYGDGNAYQGIFEANRPMLEDPDRIYPGQVLRIPAR